MNIKVANDLISRITERQGDKYIGTPINMPIINFKFRQEGLKLPKIEKPNIVTIK